MRNFPNTFNSLITPRNFYVFLILIAIAALPRLYNLGELSFYMDEETTSFASKAMANGESPQMPSGMPYYRSLPHTWLNSISARLIGINDELSYRMPGAILGILSIPLLFFLAKPFVGTKIALLASLMLALSEWHIIISRQARMYSPFLFFYVASVFAILQWAKNDRPLNLFAASILFIFAATFHNLGVFAAFVPFIALFIRGYCSTPSYKLILFAIVAGVIAYFYGKAFVSAPYQEWITSNGISTSKLGTRASLFEKINLPFSQLVIIASISTFLGSWLAHCSRFHDSEIGADFRLFVRFFLSIVFVYFVLAAQIHGAFLAIILLLLLYPYSINQYLKQAYLPLTIIVFLGITVASISLYKAGIITDVKSLLAFPYPNWLVINEISTGITLLFAAAMIYLSFTNKDENKHAHLAILGVALFPIIAVGIFKKWAPARYLIEAYPFIILSASYFLLLIINKLANRSGNNTQKSLIISIFVLGSGILGGHGLVAAYSSGTMQHGSRLNEAALIFPVYPDHKNPGEYVSKHRQPSDIVIAEDVLMQTWYAGKIHYWLRNPKTHMSYLFKTPDGMLHDIYVNSTIASSSVLDELLISDINKVWVITSGETFYSRSHYLSNEQTKWLKTVESKFEPLFIGEDGITKIYCINCE